MNTIKIEKGIPLLDMKDCRRGNDWTKIVGDMKVGDYFKMIVADEERRKNLRVHLLKSVKRMMPGVRVMTRLVRDGFVVWRIE